MDYAPENRSAFLRNNCPEDVVGFVVDLVNALSVDDGEEVSLISNHRLSEAVHLVLDHADSESDDRSELGEYEAQSVGSYQLVRELGRGGMGVCYLAINTRGTSDEPLALKILSKNLMSGESTLRFRRERIMLAAVQSPHVPKLLDAGTTSDGRPYFVMEFVHGQALHHFIREHNPTLIKRLEIFQQICRAVQDVHLSFVVHRDVKPSNILISEVNEGLRVVLIDFGIATVSPEITAATKKTTMHADPTERAASVLELTQEKLAPHTPRFASPEQRSGAKVTQAADIYALGAILGCILDGPIEDPVQSIIDKATHSDPSGRYDSAAELAEAVRSVA